MREPWQPVNEDTLVEVTLEEIGDYKDCIIVYTRIHGLPQTEVSNIFNTKKVNPTQANEQMIEKLRERLIDLLPQV